MLNSCNFQGRLAADPELRTTQSGISVTSFRMAVDRSKADEDGNRQVDWLSFTAWRNTAEFICKYFSKGSQMVVESHCQTRKYQDKNGEDRIATEFIVDKAHFCGPKQSSRQEPVDDGGYEPAVIHVSESTAAAAPADGIFHPEPAAAVAGRRSCSRSCTAQLLAG